MIAREKTLRTAIPAPIQRGEKAEKVLDGKLSGYPVLKLNGKSAQPPWSRTYRRPEARARAGKGRLTNKERSLEVS